MQQAETKKIVITGYNGLIGSELIKQLSASGNAKTIGVGRSINKNVEICSVDLSTDWDTDSLPVKADAVIHLAQSEKFRDFPDSAEEVFRVNTLSTLKLLDYARKAGAKKFIYASSGGVYGNSNVGFNEDDPVRSNKDLGFYLGSKFCSEILAENYTPFFDVQILRFFFVYGKTQKPSMLIPRLLNTILDGKEITIQGESGIRINPVHVSDAAAAVVRSLDLNGSHKINIAGPEVLSLRELCEMIGSKVNRSPRFIIQDAEPKHLFGDISKMQNLLLTPTVKFNDGVNELIEKYAPKI